MTKGKHHTKRHSGWGWTNAWKFCPLCNLGVRCIVVRWLGTDWLRCNNCLMKLPISKINQKILEYGYPKLKYKTGLAKEQTLLIPTITLTG